MSKEIKYTDIVPNSIVNRYKEERLAQPEQEPVAWMNDSGGCFLSDGNKYSENWIALYTAQPKREPLTSKLISLGNNCHESFIKGVRFAEKMHGIRHWRK